MFEVRLPWLTTRLLTLLVVVSLVLGEERCGGNSLGHNFLLRHSRILVMVWGTTMRRR